MGKAICDTFARTELGDLLRHDVLTCPTLTNVDYVEVGQVKTTCLKNSRGWDALLGTIGRPGEIGRQLPLQDSLNENCAGNCAQTMPLIARRDGTLHSIQDLPVVNIILDEGSSILNPARMKLASVFRDISRQRRKFGLGLTVVSQ